MELGVQIEPQFGFSFDDVVAIARDAEAADFRSVWVSDHLFLDKDAMRTDCLEAWTLLAALATRTERIRLGPMVTAQSYRNPALLAKVAAGVDRISGGRLDFGLGAGWKEVEYRAYGYAFPPPAIRVDQLVDTLEICTRMWTQERATYHGRHYRIDDALCSPKPVQEPLPIWIGGRLPRVMRTAAKYAQVFNYLPSTGFPSPEQSREGRRLLHEACRAAGRDPTTLRYSAFLYVLVAETDAEVDTIVNEIAGRAKVSPADWRASRPGSIVGTPDAVIAKLRDHAAAGVDHANVMFPYRHERSMVRLLGEPAVAALA